jgi:hypothetical protein
MAISVQRKSYGTGGSGVSTQSQILQHFLESMDDIRFCIGGGGENAKESHRMENFQLLTLYLRKLIPDRKVQDEIRKMIGERRAEYIRDKTFSSEDLATYAAHLETITEVMIYLNQGMNLIHNNATASLTRRAAAHSKIPVGEENANGSADATIDTNTLQN